MNLKNNVNCLIVGGSGYIGKNLIKSMDREGFNITLLGRETTDFSFIDKHSSKIKILKGDFSRPETFNKALQNQNSVINLMGASLPGTSMINPKEDIDNNIIPSLYMLQAAVINGVRKIIFSSSGGAIYGETNSVPISEEQATNPLNIYGISKLTIEKMMLLWNHVYNMDNLILRIGNVYGSGQNTDRNFGAVAIFLDKIINKKKIEIWGRGDIVRDYIYIDDVVNAFILSLNANLNKSDPKIFNIGTEKGTSINDLIKIIEKISKIKSNVIYQPERAIDVRTNFLKIELARKYLKYEPKFSLEDGIKKML